MISVDNLTKNYGDLCALDKISFTINRGEVLGLLGPNGAGKTTCMRILTCYMSPTSGDITVEDLNIHENSREIKKNLGYLPENAPLYPDMLVYDYLLYIASSRQIPGEKRLSRIKYLADVCGITSVMHKPVAELSKGFKQRVGLAQAMMGDPDILVLDEPTSGLDPNQIIEIREIIKKIGKQKTVILSTHILSEAEATCDRVVIINKGKIVADGDINSLKESAGKEADLFVSLKKCDPHAAVRGFESVTGVTRVEAGEKNNGVVNLKLSCRTGDDIRDSVYGFIKNQDWVLVEFIQKTKSLEKIFRELTKES